MIETHKEQRRLLARAIERGRISHAYLFAGPEGAGKRTLALEFAASLLCENRAFPPCRTCHACPRVLAEKHPDVVRAQIDGRNIKIQEIRDLNSRLHLHSYEGGYKLGLVFQAELMNEASQNAFLKFLEEPTPETVLIMTTANLNRLLPTIISRCLVLRIPPLPDSVIVELLKKERGLDRDQAGLVAALAQGNARRALDFDLELVLDFRKDILKKLLGLGMNDRIAIMEFAESLVKSSYVDEAIFDLLAGFYSDVLHKKLGVERIRNRDLMEEVEIQAEAMHTKEIIQKMEMIHNAQVRASGNANQKLNWEILTMSIAGVEAAGVSAL
jgi:DNA polymerase-3 subunit delta'